MLASATGEWFDQSYPSPFMVLVYSVLPEKRDLVPAITHVDGTGRLQTVEEAENPRYHRLIAEFERQTGVPILLNTSFNESEPIVMTPERRPRDVREDADRPARARELRRAAERLGARGAQRLGRGCPRIGSAGTAPNGDEASAQRPVAARRTLAWPLVPLPRSKSVSCDAAELVRERAPFDRVCRGVSRTLVGPWRRTFPHHVGVNPGPMTVARYSFPSPEGWGPCG